RCYPLGCLDRASGAGPAPNGAGAKFFGVASMYPMRRVVNGGGTPSGVPLHPRSLWETSPYTWGRPLARSPCTLEVESGPELQVCSGPLPATRPLQNRGRAVLLRLQRSAMRYRLRGAVVPI